MKTAHVVSSGGGGPVYDAKLYAILYGQKRRLSRLLDQVDGRLRELEERLKEAMIEQGVGSMHITGLRATVHLRKETWSQLVVPEGWTEEEARLRVARILEDMGLGKMVTYNHMSMRGLVIEMADEEGRLPLPLGEFVRAETKHRVGVRRA